MIRKLTFSLVALSCLHFCFAANSNAIDTRQYTPEQQTVLATATSWQQALGARNPKALMALYDKDPHFYPTFSDELTTWKEIDQYFVKLSKKPGLQVVFNQESPRVYGNVAINSGIYTFSYSGEHHNTVTIPARFTFVYLKENGRWMIIEHHSSVLPANGL